MATRHLQICPDYSDDVGILEIDEFG